MPHRQDPIDEPERLRRTLVHLETAQRIGRMGSWSGELTHDYELYLSPATRAILDWGPDWLEPTFAQIVEMIHPADRPRFRAMRDAALAGEGDYDIDLRLATSKGEYRHVHLAAEIERDDTGRPIRMIGIAQDITDSVQLFDRLLETEAARRTLLHRLMHTSDDERSRLAADLHDGPVQDLTALTLRLEHLVEREFEHDAEFRPVLDGLHRVMGTLRNTLFELNPTALGHGGLRSTLEHLVATIVPDAHAEIEVDLQHELGDATTATVVRIAQEALHNVRKHAGATKVTVRLGSDGSDTWLEVTDDGSGFDAELPAEPGHLGLTAMRERAEAAGGELHLRTSADGTTVSALVPAR